MKTVYKYALEGNGIVELSLPAGADVLSVGAQGEGMFLWAEVNTEAPLVKRLFVVFGTGHCIDMPEDVSLDFIGTIFMFDAQLVFHAYEVLQ